MSEAKASCPECGASCLSVATQTMKHHIKTPWLWDDGGEGYYFCASQDCETVYFNSDDCIKRDAMRQTVGVKCNDLDALICYCFDVSRRDAANPAIKAFVSKQTKTKQCACLIRNPSGRCCLKDFKV